MRAHLLTSADISIFSLKMKKFCYMRKYSYRLHLKAQILDISTFFESSKVTLVTAVEFSVISAKLVTLGLLKINIFWNKGHGIITSVYDVTNQILLRDSNYAVDLVMWPKFGNSNISMREVTVTSIP